MSTFTLLDFKIYDNEITDAISKVKANKSDGLQLISNNMIKSAQTFLLPSLKLLFNKILKLVLTLKIGLMVIFLLFSNLAIKMILMTIME